MGWFWGSSDNEDPVKKIDPGLRQYLENETPKEYVPGSQSIAEQVKAAQSGHHVQNDSAAPSESSQPPVPSASLYPDGRYAHLWKTYKPSVEKEVTPAQMVADNKVRRNTVRNAALENCALENEAMFRGVLSDDASASEKLYSKMTMSSDVRRQFSRCYETQYKFLQALGYASSVEWNEQREERIQMHADKLYHDMLDYEKRVEEARAVGQEPPPLKSLFNPKAEAQSAVNDSDKLVIPGVEKLPENFQPSKDLEKLTPHERELEVRAHYANLERLKVLGRGADLVGKDDAREKRQEKIAIYLGETVAKWLS
ncbi:hypothetical protein BJX61DRAFT_488993 [Aspergillus egyptiacus]|nr:hypothetical protein BJX61DRAFT_488993 [Aspergillus egyptiacus]